MTNKTNQTKLREEMKYILSRNAGRIPERLENDIDALVDLFTRQHRQMIPEELTDGSINPFYVAGFEACRQQMLDKLEGDYEN